MVNVRTGMMRLLAVVAAVLLVVLAYFVWDGLIPRTLDIEMHGRAKIVGSGWVAHVEGHSQPIKILQDIANWLGPIFARFERVNE
jgi:hypothetical protein